MPLYKTPDGKLTEILYGQISC